MTYGEFSKLLHEQLELAGKNHWSEQIRSYLQGLKEHLSCMYDATYCEKYNVNNGKPVSDNIVVPNWMTEILQYCLKSK